MVEMGYAIAGINYVGGLGEGEAHINKLLGQVGTLDVQSCTYLIDKVLAAFKEFDANRIILYGGSHGGFLSTWLAGLYPDRWKAAVIQNPAIDYYGMLLTSDLPDVVLGISGHDTHAKLSPELVVDLFKRSPITVAHQVKVPVLLMFGGSDLRVPNSQGFAWLHRLPEDTPRMIRLFPSDGHALDKPETERDSMETISSFLTKYAQ